jgi:hypothetical protein
MLPDDPADLIAGKDYGSEGVAQRYLCALLINDTHYGYNKSWPLSDRGARFVAQLYEQAFGAPPEAAPRFWNECNLRAVRGTDDHAVDYAFLWPDVHFLVELKTLGQSHRPGQLSEYMRRAHHHNPGPAIDLLYLTQPMSAAAPDDIPGHCRYSHIDWPSALEIANAVWADSPDPREVRCLSLLRDHLEAEGALAPAERLATRERTPSTAEELPAPWLPVLEDATASAARAAAGTATAISVPLGLIEDEAYAERLEQLKRRLEERIAVAPELSGVTVWRWRTTTGGSARTEAGWTTGFELRLTPPRQRQPPR